MSHLPCLCLVLLKILIISANDGAEYLHSAMKDLQEQSVFSDDYYVPASDGSNLYDLLRLTTQAPLDRSDQFEQDQLPNYQNTVPSISLTKGELLALYESAVKQGNVLNADTNTAVHDLSNYDNNVASTSHHSADNSDNQNGYYYYYYPLKALIDDINNSSGSYGPYYNQEQQNTLHSHTHLHNIKIQTPPFGVLPVQNHQPKNKALEPLFMAISSFMGMAMMFLFSMVFLPQFRNTKSRSEIKQELPSVTFSEVVFEAIEGHDCRERIYCEAGKILKTLKLNDNRFVKFFQRIIPNRFSRSIERIRQEAQKKRKCVLIQCKRKRNDSISSANLKMQPKLTTQQKNKNTTPPANRIKFKPKGQ